MYYPYIDKYDLYDNAPIYILILIVLIILSMFIYIKLAFPFWNIQPVYHTYDFWRTLYSRPFIVHKRFSTKFANRFCKLQEVEIVPFVNATVEQKKQFVDLLQCYYLSSETSMFVFHLENLEAYFSGHMFSTYLSFYIEKYYNKGSLGETVTATKPTACISSRSGYIYLFGQTDNVYYIDFICVERGKNFRTFSRNMLQTHIYKQQFLDKLEDIENPILVSLFRRDIELLTGIVPLARFITQYYRLPNNADSYFSGKLPEHFVVVEIGATNMNLFLDFMVGVKSRFSVFAVSDIANLEGLIKSGVLYVYCLKKMDEIYGVYIFRDTRTQYDDLGGMLQLCCGIMNTTSSALFTLGAMHSVGSIIKKMPVYKVLTVDDIADNGMISFDSSHRGGGFSKITENLSAYYLYNMIVPASPIRSSQVLVLF